MQIHSTDLAPNAAIPKAFTADGGDRSPALAWDGAPQGTQAYALIMDDPDAPGGTGVHWVVYDLPAGSTGLAPGQPRSENLPGGGRQGMNSWPHLGWNGPAPPPGRAHRYFFHLYALGAPLGLAPRATAAQVRQAMQGKLLAEASLMGTYGR